MIPYQSTLDFASFILEWATVKRIWGYIKTKSFQTTQESFQLIIILPIKSKMTAARKQWFLRFLYWTEFSPTVIQGSKFTNDYFFFFFCFFFFFFLFWKFIFFFISLNEIVTEIEPKTSWFKLVCTGDLVSNYEMISLIKTSLPTRGVSDLSENNKTRQ